MVSETILSISAPTTADLSSNQYHAVTIGSSGMAALAVAIRNMDGILQNAPTAGQTADILVFGKSKACLGGDVTISQLLETNSAGKFVPVGVGGTAVAKALEAGAVDDIVSVLLLESNAVYTGSGATATATLGTGANSDKIASFTVTAAGSGYVTAPVVVIADAAGVGAVGTAVLGIGVNANKVASITVTNAGSGYVAPTVTIR